jgi:hypothetical protein
MQGPLQSIDCYRLLHQPLEWRARALAAFVCLMGGAYGAVMGTFGLQHGRELQVVFSALKVPLLMLGTFGVALPSFVVMNLLLGLGDDVRRAVRAHVQAQAAITCVLLSLAPLTLVWYASTISYPRAILFNAGMFGVSTLAGQIVLRRLYRPLIAGNARHRWLLRIWLGLYAFVGIQLAWVLRPFIGNPESPTRFFRDGAWGNAYIELWNIILISTGQGRG